MSPDHGRCMLAECGWCDTVYGPRPTPLFLKRMQERVWKQIAPLLKTENGHDS